MTIYNVGIVVQARLASTRLPSKVLAVPRNTEFSILELGFLRLSKSKYSNNLIYAIPDNEPELAHYLESKGVHYFVGHPTDVMSRYLKCASAFNFDIVVRITSDCPLVDPSLLDTYVDLFIHSYQSSRVLTYLSNYTPPEMSTFCNGSDIEIFQVSALQSFYSTNPSSLYKEHVTFQFWDGSFPVHHLHQHYQGTFDLTKMRITIDYKDDLEMLARLSEKINILESSLDTIIETYFSLDLHSVNGSHGSRDGWN